MLAVNAVVVVTVTGAPFRFTAPAAPEAVKGAVPPPPKAVKTIPPTDKVKPFELPPLMVPVVFAPVAVALSVWPEPSANAVVRPDTSSVAPLAIVKLGLLEREPLPLKASVPAETVVLPE